MGKPTIVVEFEPDDSVTWHSVGWGKMPPLMDAAKTAIQLGRNPEEVVKLLQAAGFEVVDFGPETGALEAC